MRTRDAFGGCAIVLAVCLLSGAEPARVPGTLAADVAGLLKTSLGFSQDDLQALQRGQIIRRAVSTPDPREVAVAGAARVKASRQDFLDRFRAITRFKRGPAVLEIGEFGAPPTVQDLAGLTLEPDDLQALRTCRVGDCDVQLPAAAIERFRQLNWAAPDVREQATQVARELLADYVTRYQQGLTAASEYNDGEVPQRFPDEFVGLLRNSPYIARLVPTLPQHLLRYRGVPLEGGEDFVYWSKEKFGLKPVVSLTHVTIVHASAATSVITSKDIYSSRYFDASLGLTIATDAVGEPGFYLIYVNRSRADALKGGFSGLKKSVVQRRAQAGLEDTLRTTRLRLERGLP